MDETLLRYRESLENEKKKLLGDLSEAEKPEDFGSDVDHGEEEANEAESFGNKVAMARAIKGQINEIDAALQRIASGAYGACEKCGRHIEEEVLRVSPESRLCRRCKKAA